MARIDDYKESFRLASEELKSADLQQLARFAEVEIAASHDGKTEMRLSLLGSPFVIEIGDQVEILRDGQQTEVSLPDKILISHYLLSASGKPATGELIAFRQIPDGQFYYDAFQRRARDPFLATFGRNPELFLTCGGALGGKPIDAGDIGMVFQVLPRVSIRLVLWRGDDEFPPEASILFDSVLQYDLSAEDVAVLSGMLVYRLMGIARNQQQQPHKN